jgi:hypothetical protein
MISRLANFVSMVRSVSPYELCDARHICFIAPSSTTEHVIEKVTDAYFADPNLDQANLGDVKEDSPYPEVRSAVANTDDPDMPCSTIRAWILGMAMAVIIPGLNQFLWVHLLSYPGSFDST